MTQSVDQRRDDSLFPTDPSDSPSLYARVAVQAPVDFGPERSLTYASRDEDLQAGEIVRAPLGKGGRRVEGVVLEVAPASAESEMLGDLEPHKVRMLDSRLGVRLPSDLMDLGRWISSYYAAPLGTTLLSMTPTAVRSKVGLRRRVVLERGETFGSLDPGSLTPSVRVAYTRLLEHPDSLPAEPRLLRDALKLKNTAPLNRLVDAGALVRSDEEYVRDNASRLAATNHSDDAAPEPNTAQRNVIDGIAGSLGSFSSHLLFGVTGSGKTEVYLRVIKRVLEQNQSALVLVPEIALTPQTTERFQQRLGAFGVGVMHSGLDATTRYRHWRDAERGDTRVIVGARSALFAPLRNLGIVVVDEEHDSSYKQDSTPRYHGRDAAIKRAQIADCPVLLGSATPSLESYANTQTDPSRSTLWKLPERAAGRFPRVQVVDPSIGSPRGADQSPIGMVLADALRETLELGRQAILLLNRRGFATFIGCASSSCGWRLCCGSCDAAMTLHKDTALPKGEAVRCHHCLAESVVPSICPICSKGLIRLGLGVQRIEPILERDFGLTPGAGFVRVDSDTMRSARDYFGVLGRFARNEVRVLLGTQMLAKGLDIPGVRLVGVIDADTALHLPDFRASERTFQLVNQVAGRAGRADDEGVVIVQSLAPDTPAIKLAASNNYHQFASAELRVREIGRMPPVWRMARFVLSGPDASETRLACESLHRSLVASATAHVAVDPPAPCVLTRLADRFRWETRVRARSASTVAGIVKWVRSAVDLSNRVRLVIDVDPQSVL